jgi:hypothetical protein
MKTFGLFALASVFALVYAETKIPPKDLVIEVTEPVSPEYCKEKAKNGDEVYVHYVRRI